jgi:dihydrofolate reductase
VSSPLRFEGYVIVSDDGMLADAHGVMPPGIRNDADQHFFQSSLDEAALIVHGRHSHEGGPRAKGRKRLVLTRLIAGIAPDPSRSHSLLWNPAGATLEQAASALGVKAGIVAVIGGPEVFSLFLPRYDSFHLSRAHGVKIPGGRPVFTELAAGGRPEDILSRYGLEPGPSRDLDAAAGVTLVTWVRARL